jgi:uncharacterized membrane protein
MNMKTISAQRVYSWTTYIFVALLLTHLSFRLVSWSNLPPSDEVYTNDLSFQLIVFALTMLPYWIGGLLIVLIAEFVILGRKPKH